jgi:hypothetical protein
MTGITFFIDVRSSINRVTAVSPHSARAPKGQRKYDPAPFSLPKKDKLERFAAT